MMRRTESGPTMAPQMMNAAAAERSSSSSSSSGGGWEERWRHPDNNSSVNAVSFGFVATAILISMFLVMAIFERFLRPPPSRSTPPPPPSSSQAPLNNGHMMRRRGYSSNDPESQQNRRRKLDFYPSPKMSIYAKGVFVLMPGSDIPAYIAHPAPAPCPPECILWPPHDQNYLPIARSTSS